MKKLGLILSIFIPLIFYSCDSIMGVETKEDYHIRVQNVENKTTYNSFDHLKNPILFPMQIRDFGENYKGGIVVIYDTETNSIFDYVYVPEFGSALDPSMYSIKPAGNSNVCYLSGPYGSADVTLIDPTKTSVQFVPKRRTGTLNAIPEISSYVPSKQLVSRSDYGYTSEKMGILVNTLDTVNGETGKTLAIEASYPSCAITFYPYSDDKYYFVRDNHAIITLSYIDVAKNCYVDSVELINERPPLEEEDIDDIDFGDDFDLPDASFRRQGDVTEDVSTETSEEEVDPLQYIWSEYVYNVVYMNETQMVIYKKEPYSSSYYALVKEDEGKEGKPEYIITEDCFYVINRNTYEVTEISMYDYIKNCIESLVAANPGTNYEDFSYNLIGIFENNGKFYCFLDVEKTYNSRLLKVIEFDIENKKIVEIPDYYSMYLNNAYHKAGNKLYIVSTNDEISVEIGCYDFDSKQFTLVQTVKKETFGFPLK